MARPLRIEFPGAAYQVTSRGNERKAIFRDDQDRENFRPIVLPNNSPPLNSFFRAKGGRDSDEVSTFPAPCQHF